MYDTQTGDCFLTGEQYVRHLRRDAAEFEKILRAADPQALVPACAPWRLHDLGAHMGEVHRWATATVRTRERPEELPSWHGQGAVADWYGDGARGLLRTLDEADPATACWTFVADGGVTAFWFRRQAQELAMHLLDARQAAGDSGGAGFDPVLAADGVDEVLTFLPAGARYFGTSPPLPVSLLLRAHDTDHAWLLTPAETGTAAPEFRRSDGGDSAELTVLATAETLLLVIWKRRALADADLRIDGDPAVAREFLAARLSP